MSLYIVTQSRILHLQTYNTKKQLFSDHVVTKCKSSVLHVLVKIGRKKMKKENLKELRKQILWILLRCLAKDIVNMGKQA